MHKARDNHVVTLPKVTDLKKITVRINKRPFLILVINNPTTPYIYSYTLVHYIVIYC